MKNLFKFLATQNEERRKYFENSLFYAKRIKEKAKKLLPDSKVLLFGSVAKREYAADSDFDILIISNHFSPGVFNEARLKIEILKDFPNNPFEIHLVTQEQFKNWYGRFIKKDYRRV